MGEYEVEEGEEKEEEDNDDEAELQSSFNARERRTSENDEVMNIPEPFFCRMFRRFDSSKLFRA